MTDIATWELVHRCPTCKAVVGRGYVLMDTSAHPLTDDGHNLAGCPDDPYRALRQRWGVTTNVEGWEPVSRWEWQ